MTLSKRCQTLCHNLTNCLTIIGLAADHMDHKRNDPAEISKWTAVIKEECKKSEQWLRKLIDTGGAEK